MRWIFEAVAIAAGVGLLTFDASPSEAAVFSVGPSNYVYGGNVCADVSANGLDNSTAIQAWECHAGPNQQFEFNGMTIYAQGRKCWDVLFSGTANGTVVQLTDCKPGVAAQQFAYFDGQIIYLFANKCIDAQDMAEGRQLIINDCDGRESQNWQIK